MVTTSPPRSRFRLAEGGEECQRGHLIRSDADFMIVQGRRRCRVCHRARNARSARAIYAQSRANRPPRRCLCCAALVTGQRTKFCSDACAARTCGRIAWDRARARRAGVLFEPIYRIEIYERDGWICQLCKLPVQWFLEWPNDWSPVLDHRVPLSLGGDHLASNVQLAHRVCNEWKAHMGPAQYAQCMVEIGLEAWERGRAACA